MAALAVRISSILLLVLAVLTFVVGGLSIWFVEDPFEYSARVLITTFAGAMAVLAVAVILRPYRAGAPWAWWALWVYPLFFASHVAMLGTWVPDLPLALVGVLALALSARHFLSPSPASSQTTTQAA